MKLCLECSTPHTSSSWQCPSCGKTPPTIGGRPYFAPELAERNDGFPPESFAQLFDLEASNFWFRSRNQLITWALSHYFHSAKSFLEIGCGTGYVLDGIQKSNSNLVVHGSELYGHGLEHAAARLGEATLLQIDARKIPYQNEFDVIGAFDVLEHIEEDELVLAQMHKSVKQSNGGIIITVPQHRFLWSVVDEYSHHVRRYERQELIDKIEKAGFEILRSTSFVSSLLPLMYLSRLSKKNKTESYDPNSEYCLPKIANDILESVLTIERMGIKAGFSYPMGGSLLVVAKIKDQQFSS